VIPAWQKAIPLITKNGDSSLYIPPSLGYGSKDVTNPSTGQIIIPANSNLVFRVVISDIQ
jgi:FKBP-type peptidyl-prolyl cis-trans isomerase FkpA